MYVLGNAAHGWLTLPSGVQIDFAPIERPMVRAARREVRAFIAANPDMPTEELADETSDIFSGSLIRQGIRGWKGLGNADGKLLGQPTSDLITEFLADPVLFDQADAAYVLPWAQTAREKNVSSPSRNGISTGATRAKTTAISAAPVKAGAVRNAPIAKKNRKQMRVKSSGTSSRGSGAKSG